MSSFTDIFNSTFFIFLGILLLVVAILFLYFENNLRQQNHKIASMLSLVSSLAEELNSVKLGLNHISMIGAGMNFDPYLVEKQNVRVPVQMETNKLIVVSDDEASDSDTDGEDNDSSVYIFDETDNIKINEESDSDSDEEDDIEELAEDPYLTNSAIKILKLNLSQEFNEYHTELNSTDNLVEILSYNDDNENEDDENNRDDNDENEDDENNRDDNNRYTDNTDKLELTDANPLNLKTININLEEHKNNDSIDYKKVSLNKLINTITEKGVSMDASKLKKNEMLKLLGAE